MDVLNTLEKLKAIKNLPYGDQFTANGLAILCDIVGEIVLEILEDSEEVAE